MDAPVTGGDTGAKAGTLSILVGGNKEDYEACMPLFEAMGTNINYQGEAGCGQHAKSGESDHDCRNRCQDFVRHLAMQKQKIWIVRLY